MTSFKIQSNWILNTSLFCSYNTHTHHSPSNESMFSTQDDVVTGIDKCSTCLDDEGNWNCESESCSVCSGCLSEEMLAELHMAYREFHRRGNYRLIFPNLDYMSSKFLSKLSHKSKLMSIWYERMCEKDSAWIEWEFLFYNVVTFIIVMGDETFRYLIKPHIYLYSIRLTSVNS